MKTLFHHRDTEAQRTAKRLFRFLSLCLCVSVVNGFAAAAEPAPELYRKHCSECHGADRYGLMAAMNLVNGFPVAGALLATLLPLPWRGGTLSRRPRCVSSNRLLRTVNRATLNSRLKSLSEGINDPTA
jgi:hypothetical protein